VKGTQTTKFETLPSFLTLHLKRHTKEDYEKKDQCRVTFPLSLDVKSTFEMASPKEKAAYNEEIL